jgi:hypothetical protein
VVVEIESVAEKNCACPIAYFLACIDAQEKLRNWAGAMDGKGWLEIRTKRKEATEGDYPLSVSASSNVKNRNRLYQL